MKGVLGNISIWKKGVKPPFELQWGTLDSSLETGFLSSGDGNLGVPLELLQGSQGTALVASGKSGLRSSCEGQLSCQAQGTWASS